MNDDNAKKMLDRYYLHPRCYAAWEFERTKVDSTSLVEPFRVAAHVAKKGA